MGNSNSKKISDQDRAILDMKNQRDKLQQYQKRIRVITDRETEIARECLRVGDKKKALTALRKKKYQESLLSKTDQQLASLEMLTSDVEFALVQKDVLFGLQQGTAVLKEIHKEMGGLEKVEMIMEESAEARQYQEEINDVLAGKMSNQDEDEVEDELAALEREVAGKTSQPVQVFPEAPRIGKDSLPDAPTQSPEDVSLARARERRAQIHGKQAVAA